MGREAMRKFFDPSYTSCTSWIAHVASTKFGMDVAPLEELIHWADIVDGAKYESAKAAVEMGDAGDEVDDGDRERAGECAGAEDYSAADGDERCRRCWSSRLCRSCWGR